MITLWIGQDLLTEVIVTFTKYASLALDQTWIMNGGVNNRVVFNEI